MVIVQHIGPGVVVGYVVKFIYLELHSDAEVFDGMIVTVYRVLR